MPKINRELAQQIVSAVSEVCGHNINFISPAGVILASTDRERIGSFHEIGLNAARMGTTIEVSEDDSYQGTRRGVNIPVFHQGAVFAVVGITGPPDEARRFANLAVRITQLLIREQELLINARSREEKNAYLVRALLSETPENPAYLQSCLAEAGLKPEQRMLVCCIRLSAAQELTNISRLDSALQQFFLGLELPFFVLDYPDRYTVLVPEHKAESFRQRLDVFAQKHAQELRAGIGTLKKLSRLPESQNEAQTALRSLAFSARPWADFEQLDIEMLLGGTDPACRARFAAKTTNLLDPAEHALLRIFFEENHSITKTAERLFLHKNTVQYQLNRIWRKCGYNPREFRDAVALYLGLRLLPPE